PLLPVLAQPLWNYHSSQKLLDSRAPLRSLLGNRVISLGLKSLHELLVITRQLLLHYPSPVVHLRILVKVWAKHLDQPPERPHRPNTKNSKHASNRMEI